MTDHDYAIFFVAGTGKSTNPKALRREDAAGTRTDKQLREQLKGKSAASEDEELVITAEFLTPGLDSQLRNKAEVEFRNPLFQVVKLEGEAPQAMDTTMDVSHAMQVAAHRWDLFTNFAGTQIADALRENSRADKALQIFSRLTTSCR